MKTITARWSICGSGGPITARQIEIDTPHGTLLVGLDGSDRVYIDTCAPATLSLRPQSVCRTGIEFEYPRS
jgi:hypothetical protein